MRSKRLMGGLKANEPYAIMIGGHICDISVLCFYLLSQASCHDWPCIEPTFWP